MDESLSSLSYPGGPLPLSRSTIHIKSGATPLARRELKLATRAPKLNIFKAPVLTYVS